MERVRAAGIEVIALADHHGCEWLDDMRAAGSRAGVTVFPGLEITTGSGADGVHLLIVGDLDWEPRRISEVLAADCGFTDDHPPFDRDGTPLPSPESLTRILDRLRDDCIVIAPHALNDNGIASGNTQRGSLKWKALHHDRLSALDVGDPRSADGEVDGHSALFRRRELTNYPCLEEIAFVSTSDAYRLETLGSRFTWIRMSAPTLEGLRQAFLDHEARIVCDWDPRLRAQDDDPNRVRHAWISRIEFKGCGNTRQDFAVEFDPRFNVIIGGRGSGKSTVVSGLRQLYATSEALPPQLRAEDHKFVAEVFADAEINSTHHLEVSGEAQAAAWTRPTGSTTIRGGAETATDFPVRVVGQKELFERAAYNAGDPFSASRNILTLIDEALGLEPLGIGVDQRDGWMHQARRVRDLRGLEVEHPALSARVGELRRQVAAFDDPQAKHRRERNDALLAEAAAADEVLNLWKQTVALLGTDMVGHLDTLDAAAAAPEDQAPSAYSALLSAIRSANTQLRAGMEKAIEAANGSVTDAANAWRTGPRAEEIAAATNDAAAYRQELIAAGVEPGAYDRVRAELSEAVRSLESLESRIAELPEAIRAEDAAWHGLVSTYTELREHRSRFLASISGDEVGLRFHVESHGDTVSWVTQVRQLLNIRADGFLEDVPATAEYLWLCDPETRPARLQRWREGLVNGDVGFLNEVPGVRASWIGRLRELDEAVRLRLATLFPSDAIRMEFLRTEGDASVEDDWRSITDGSPGERSAAMLTFMLCRGADPIVLDQPEDDLDSEWISDLVVPRLRASRWSRQLIVVSHNANIPVNGDAERVIVLENRDGTIAVRSTLQDGVESRHAGPIEDPLVRRDIQDIMEGGVAAFVRRERRYNNELNRYRLARARMPAPPSG